MRYIIEILWRLFARIVTCRPVTLWLRDRALKTPYRHIMSQDGKSIYMGRWWLFNPYPESGAEKRFGWLPSVRIHYIIHPDQDRCLHDHPWNARTIILDGWYTEQREDGRIYRRSNGYTGRLMFGEFHRIEEVSHSGALTMFITWKYRGEWGFNVGGVKVPWREYLDVKS